MSSQPLSSAVRFELARARVQRGGCARLSMRGCSMLPLLHEPHVLDVVPVRAPLKTGDVVVFRSGEVHVAHRVVRVEGERVVASGDAQPERIDIVPRDEILGRVERVWADGRPHARRIDGMLFRLRGGYYARFHSVRRALRRLRRWWSVRAPWTRPRPVLRLYGLLRGLQSSGATPEQTIRAELTDDVVDAAVRHRCAGFFPPFALMPQRLVHARLGAQLNTMRLLRQIDGVVALLRERRVPVALLKGAARLYGRDERMRAHPSADIDLLVPPEYEDCAVQVLAGAGYEQRADEAARHRYRTQHHHAAPLYRRDGRAVEIHRALAPPAMFATRTTWHDLEPHLRAVREGLFVLDRHACALHAAMHAALTFSLRDLAFLSEQLQQMNAPQRERLWRDARADRFDPVRLGGVLALASDFAQLPCGAGSLERLYARWLLRRADLPGYLRRRCEAVDAAFLLCTGRARQAWRIFVCDGHGAKTAGRFFTGIAALVYALLMKDAP